MRSHLMTGQRLSCHRFMVESGCQLSFSFGTARLSQTHQQMLRFAQTGAAAVVLALMIAPPLAARQPHKAEHKEGKSLLTFYWIIDESSSRYGGKPVAELRDVRGRVIAHTSRKFRKALVMEGSGWLRDGRVVVYDRKVNGEHRFRISPSKYGFTVTGCALVPYRTVAVDPHVIRLGSTIYIPQLKGAVLPDGTTHDGMFIATDRGHFRGRHIDIFVGNGHRGSAPFIRKGYGSRSRVTVKVVRADGGCRP